MTIPRSQLQPTETDNILNIIDRLRSIGVGDILELPQIIVCGDQSSGKSSVLNAVSTLKFPTKDGLCTRFATEVIMRPDGPEGIVASIVPRSGRTDDEKRTLGAFRRGGVTMDGIGSIIDEANRAMGIEPEKPHGKRFSDDILRFEVTGPGQPSLTLVDLPGFFRAESIYQTKEDMKSVQELVLRYMRNKRSLILAVVSAKSDFVLQSVTEFSSEEDPTGTRTFGVITKPDTLHPGSDDEKMFIELAENKLKCLHRGWHVLVNRDHSSQSCSQEERDDRERIFLSTGAWAKIPANKKGVFKLSDRLSNALREHILEGLPDLMKEAEAYISRYKDILASLGASRSTAEEGQRYLVHAAQLFSVTMQSCINGSYDTAFFNGDQKTYRQKRLRATVQDVLGQYSDEMQHHGHAKHIVDDADEEDEGRHSSQVSQTEFEDSVMKLMEESRGRELMVTPNPLIVRDLFYAQSEPWLKITDACRQKLVRAAERCIDLVLLHAVDEHTGSRLKNLIIKPRLQKLLDSMNATVEQVMKGRRESHPITYSPSLADNIAKAKQKRAERLFADKYDRAINQGGQVVAKDTLKWLFEEYTGTNSTGLRRFAASEAIIQMRAYYKIAREAMVDNFARLAIEDCLISQMPCLLNPDSILSLDESLVSEIAMETEDAFVKRTQTMNNLEMCQSALENLRQIESMRAPALRAFDEGIPAQIRSVDADDRNSSPDRSSTGLSKLDLGLSEREADQPLDIRPVEDLLDYRKLSRKKDKKRVLDQNGWPAET